MLPTTAIFGWESCRHGGSDGKESACNAGDLGSVPDSGRSPGEGNSNPCQYFCLENSTDRGAWRATVHKVVKSQTWLRANTYSQVQRPHWLPVYMLICLFVFFFLKPSTIVHLLQGDMKLCRPPYFSRAVSQSYLRSCLLCYTPQFGSNKTFFYSYYRLVIFDGSVS